MGKRCKRFQAKKRKHFKSKICKLYQVENYTNVSLKMARNFVWTLTQENRILSMDNELLKSENSRLEQCEIESLRSDCNWDIGDIKDQLLCAQICLLSERQKDQELINVVSEHERTIKDSHNASNVKSKDCKKYFNLICEMRSLSAELKMKSSKNVTMMRESLDLRSTHENCVSKLRAEGHLQLWSDLTPGSVDLSRSRNPQTHYQEAIAEISKLTEKISMLQKTNTDLEWNNCKLEEDVKLQIGKNEELEAKLTKTEEDLQLTKQERRNLSLTICELENTLKNSQDKTESLFAKVEANVDQANPLLQPSTNGVASNEGAQNISHLEDRQEHLDGRSEPLKVVRDVFTQTTCNSDQNNDINVAEEGNQSSFWSILTPLAKPAAYIGSAALSVFMGYMMGTLAMNSGGPMFDCYSPPFGFLEPGGYVTF